MNRPARAMRAAAGLVSALIITLIGTLAACGGGSPLDNPPLVDNPSTGSGQKLSFAYFQRCINPIFLASLQTVINGQVSTSTCAGSGCHADATGTGGALRIVPDAGAQDLTQAAALLRASAMYKNFVSAQGEVVIGSPTQSRLLTKPLLLNVLHGGGLIFESQQDLNVLRLQYWISNPVPNGQDEFSTASDFMLAPGFNRTDPTSGTCNTQ